MTLTATSWKAVVDRKWKTTGAFKELDDAVKDYLAHQTNPKKLVTLKKKWDAWTSKFTGKDYTKSDRYVKGGALDDLAVLCAAPAIGGSAQVASLVAARENRVVAKQTANLVFTMTGGTDLSVNMPLRYNLRKTGLGRQDAELQVELPILVHQGTAAKQYWEGQGWSGDSFDHTTHGHHPGVAGATAGSDVKKRWNKAINDFWGNAAVIHKPASGPERYFRLKFEFSFTDDASKACKEVCCVETTGDAAISNPSGTIDAVRWGANDSGPGGPICHEVGHFLGCPDEYFTITYDGQTKAWGPGYTLNSVMNNPDTPALARHYKKMGQELAHQFGFPNTEAWLILDVTLGLDNPAQKKHKLSGHIWEGV
jgi:hypothetical protein